MTESVERVSLPEILAIIGSGRRIIVRIVVATIVVVATVVLSLPRSFTASASFMPEGTASGVSELSAIAGQFGFSVPIGDAGSTPAFYSDLVRSEMMLRELVQLDIEDLPAARQRGVQDVVGWYEAEGDTREEAIENAILEFRDDLRVSLARETGVIEVAVSLHDPAVATRIVDGILRLINDFNIERRQRQISQERAFAAEQLTAAEDDLERVENELRNFLQANRMFENSPELLFERDRLQRQVVRREQIVLSLQRSFDQARIEEVRTTPVITVLQPPLMPAQPDRRRLVVKVLVAALLALTASTTLVVARDLGRRSLDRHPRVAALLRSTYADLRRESRRPWLLLFGKGRDA